MIFRNMAENQDTPHTQAATPASNQNLIIGIVMGAVILLLFLLVLSQQGILGGSSKSGDIAELKKELKDAQNDLASAKGATLAGGSDANTLVGNIKRDADALIQFISISQAELARLRGSEAAQQDLYGKIGSLQSQLTQAQAAQGQVSGLQAQLQNAQQRIQQLTDQLGNSVDQGTVARLREQIKGVQEEREDLRSQLATLRAETNNMVNRDELDELRKLIPENRALRLELQELRAQLDQSKLFVTRDNLSPRAAKLFKELERLEGNTPQALKQAYRRIEQDSRASVMETASFKTGSSALAPEHESHIKDVIIGSPANSFFLVVGYASQTGDVQVNRELSRKRATRTAQVVNHLKRKGHQVQAVYLGETNRFGADASRNQVCEIWEIRP